MPKKSSPDVGPALSPEALQAARAGARLQAEAKLAERFSEVGAELDLDPRRIERLAHELGVHQIELELQNEELQQAQQALESSRDRYLDLYEQAPVAYLSFTLHGVIVQSNPRAHMLFGRPMAELHHRRVNDLIDRDHRPRLQKHLAQLLAGRGEQALELKLLLPNGVLCWAELRMNLTEGDVGGPQVRAALIDVTERVEAQQTVARLATIVASCEEAIVSRDLEGRVGSWNEAAERLFGRSAQQMLGHTMSELVPEAEVEHEAELLRRAGRGEATGLVQTERLGADGASKPVLLSISPLRGPGGEVEGSALIARDVSELRSAERALGERMRQLDLLASTGEDLILGDSAHDPLPRRLFERVSRSVHADVLLYYALGTQPGALELHESTGLGEATRQAMRLAEPDASLCGLVAQRGAPVVIDSLQNSLLPQAAALRGAGVRAYAGFPLLAKKHLYGVVAFGSTTHDRFDEKDLQVIETVCRQASAMLERAELLDQLHANEAALKRADRAKDEFIATLAHELRNPLAPIRNALAILKREDAKADPNRAEWCRDIIDRQVVQMTHLLEDLLDVSRVTRNLIELRRADIDLRLAVNQALETTAPLFDARRHRLTIDMPEVRVPFNGDLTRLNQVFTNLLANAGKYTDPRGDVSLKLEVQEDAIVVTVRDNGIGIEPAQLPRVFEMFAQLTPALERSAGGLGIGLALTRGLVELHGGSIEAHSDGPGLGSVFTVRLPRNAAAGAQDSATGRSDRHDASTPRRLLVVDDNVDAATSLCELLQLQGHEVRTAFGGHDGLRVAREWRPEVVLLDIGMADLNGYEVCRSIRAEAWGQGMLLVACTGWGQKSDRGRALEAGFDVHLVKPIEPQAVSDLLARP